VTADGSGKLAWEKNVRVYVPSLLARDGHLYAVLDAGVAMCLKSDTGETVWTERLGGNFSSSPVLADDKIFATSESGRTFIFAASPEEFDLVAENDLGDEAIASPVICGGRIYLRVAEREDGVRREALFCVGR
jgi:outer membrane protein assembly factor BamB